MTRKKYFVLFLMFLTSLACKKSPGKKVSGFVNDVEKSIQKEKMEACLADPRLRWSAPTEDESLEIDHEYTGVCYVKDFSYYCENKNDETDSDKQHTIDVIRSIFPGETCEEVLDSLDEYLMDSDGNDSIDLSYQGLKDLSPLIGLQLRGINLEGNHIQDLWGLAAINKTVKGSYLKRINLDGNPIATGEVEKTERNCMTSEYFMLGPSQFFDIPNVVREFCTQ